MRPVFYLFDLAGTDLTDTLLDRTVRLTVTDAEGLESDILDVELDDRGQFVALPAIGDRVRLLLGYLERPPIPTIGDFVVDEVRLSGPPLSIGFTAKGADFVNTSIKAPLIDDGDDDTLDALARRIAERQGLEPNIHPDAVQIPIGHVDQQTESDMALITRLARDRDWVLRLDARRLTLRPHAANLQPALDAGQWAPPLHHIDARQITRYDYTTNARSRYGKVRAWYYDPDTGRRVPVEVEDGQNPDYPTLDLRHDAKDERAALDLATARLRQLRRSSASLALELPGDTRILAGHHVLITGLSDPIAGQWVIQRADHTLDANGLRTRLECVPPSGSGKAKEGTIENLIEEVE
ncbi:MAG: late control protein D [Porticoccaceae bacterium]|nr:MAG: late control protein D [Porticoccaceae bacterium]